MAPTPPSADSPSHDEKTRRNVACVNCRNSKASNKASYRLRIILLVAVLFFVHFLFTFRSSLEAEFITDHGTTLGPMQVEFHPWPAMPEVCQAANLMRGR